VSIPDKINNFRKDPVDYALDGGLSIVAAGETGNKITADELAGRSAEVNAKIGQNNEPEKITINLDDEKQLVGHLFNRGVSDDLIIYNYMWNGNYGEEKGKGPSSEQHEAEYLAAAFPDKQLLFINQPGFGGSSELPTNIAKQIAKTGDYAPLGEYIGERLRDHLKNELGHLAVLAIYGGSMGALRASSYAEKLTDIADEIRVGLVDPTGSRKFSLLGLAFDYALKEGIHTAGYRQHADNIDRVSADKRKESAKLTNFMRDKVFRKKSNDKPKERSNMFSYVRGLTRGSLRKNLENLRGLNRRGDRVDMYSLGRSEISDNSKMAEIANDLKNQGQNINHHTIPDVTHAFAKGKPVVDETLIRRLFEDVKPGENGKIES
jgi:pimeloyl-ACP methyl ester carboxylesterase